MISPIPHAISRRAALRQIAAFSGAAATWCGGCANRAHETGRSPLEQFRSSKADSRLLEELERSATMFFREAAHPETGLVLDRKRADGGPDPRTVASIAATGFGLSVLCLAHDRRHAPRAELRSQIVRTLRGLLDRQAQEHGFFHHFVHWETGERVWQCELSSVDSAILFCGALHARAYFAGDAEIHRLATALFNRADWPWFLNGRQTLSMGWKPESGFLKSHWDHYCELMLINLLGLGSPTHPLAPETWREWSRPEREYEGERYVWSPAPLFVHQFSHAWFDFRNRLDAGTDWFANSVAATRAHLKWSLRQRERFPHWSEDLWGVTSSDSAKGYAALHRYVRRPGIESDFHVLEPLEFHADTTHLVQLLKQGHHGVKLDAEAWDRLVTWIDLNTPYHGTWGEEIASPGKQRERRRELLKRYANVEDDPEAVPVAAPVREVRNVETTGAAASLPPGRLGSRPSIPDWPFDAIEAKRRQAASAPVITRRVELAPGVTLDLLRVPAGEFLMGSPDGTADEQPVSRVRIAESFWMARCEINNAQFACFNPAHDSRVEDKNTYQFGIHGYPANEPAQPVVRVSWQEAMAFCRWLGTRTGRRFTLPTEAQWEWACRAGASTPFSFGAGDSDFSAHANFADAKLREFASDPYTVDKPFPDATPYDDWIPKDARFNDGALIAVAPGRYLANAWGLHDLHGNVAEWTRSTYAAYPWAADGRDDESRAGRKVVRGGSWRDVPARGTASFRLSYEPWQRVYNVGFRVVCEGELKDTGTTASTTGVDSERKISTR